MELSLDKNISLKMLLLFALPTVVANVLMGIYSSIDAVFVARFIGAEGLSAVNIVMPLLMLIIAVSFMLGTGGNAYVAKKLGENKINEARSAFSLIVVIAVSFSIVLAIIGYIFHDQLIYILGADETIYELCISYLYPLLVGLPFVILGFIFQQFFISDGKPSIGLIGSIIGGILNIFLDYFLIVKLGMGLQGAAIATTIGYGFPAIIGLVYFMNNKKEGLYLTKFNFDLEVIYKSLSNGMSEMITIAASGITMILMNNIIIRISGINGVAAVTIIMTVHAIITNIYMGYASGIAPIVSFNYGKNYYSRLKKIYEHSINIISVVSVLCLLICFIFASSIVTIFVPKDGEVYLIAVRGFRLSAIGFMFLGFNNFASTMFTALNNGKVSAVLSSFRTLIFLVISLITLPFFFGLNGVWLAIPVAEIMAICMSMYYNKKMKVVYKYAD
ncbi:MATE family efflux transporter [Mycoplasma sp. P36-A1]|uniref:MATE family efflux transporter n=1 Tax=Mycoplasma sp. P36-A1 TaxID=3252900 RepID=UPI003C2AE44C